MRSWSGEKRKEDWGYKTWKMGGEEKVTSKKGGLLSTAPQEMGLLCSQCECHRPAGLQTSCHNFVLLNELKTGVIWPRNIISNQCKKKVMKMN